MMGYDSYIYQADLELGFIFPKEQLVGMKKFVSLDSILHISGVPILVNTSFNIRGEPIVCTPHDAYRCMMGTEIDCLIMGKFLIYRKENLRDRWDAEVSSLARCRYFCYAYKV